MKSSKIKIGFGKKAFITDILVDFWAYILFVLVVIIFAIFYNLSAEAKLQAVEDVKDVAYGNYLAQVYLRTPVDVAGTKMTMAELISLYDYNQSLEKASNSWKTEMLSVYPFYFAGNMMSRRNPLWQSIESITNSFVENNFKSNICYAFSIKGRYFEYSRLGKCNSDSGFQISTLLQKIGVSKETFITYVPSVDPRDKPIEIYSVYNFRRLMDLYTTYESRDFGYWSTPGMVASVFCQQYPDAEKCLVNRR